MESFEELFNSTEIKELKKGDVIEGEVVSVKGKTIYLSVGGFTEGVMHLDHYTKDKNVESFDGLVKVGDVIKCTVTAVKEESIYLSRLNQLSEDTVKELEDAKANGNTVSVKVEAKNPNGYECKYKTLRVFMPRSQASRDVEVGQEITVNVLDVTVDGKRTNVVVSRKEIAEKELAELKNAEYEKINEGDVLTGKVVKIEKFGALVNFGYVTGLLKVNEVAHEFVDITKALTIGEEIEVKVMSKDNGKVNLSRKALIESPFNLYIKDHKVSDTVKGKLANKLAFGLLIELAPGVKGLLHRSEFSHNPNDNFAASVVIGDEVEVSIINIDESIEKISLSRKPLLDNPWDRVDVKTGDIVNVSVEKIMEKGLVVNVEGVDGFIPGSESGAQYGKLKEAYQVGDKVDAIIIECNPKEWKLKLSVKKLKDMKERAEFEKHNTNEDAVASIGDQFGEELNK